MRRSDPFNRRTRHGRSLNRRSSLSARRVTFAAIALVAAWGSTTLASHTPSELVIEPALLTRLQTLAEGLHREIVLCLEGRVWGDRAIVTDFVMPTPRLSTPTRSSFDQCPAGTLASWHNHPRSAATPASSRHGSGSASRRLCVLSETDIRTAERLRHPFVVVAVDARTWCWWGIDEVDSFAARSISPAPPSPERIARADLSAAWARPSTIEAPSDR